jgi:hypothetical protein
MDSVLVPIGKIGNFTFALSILKALRAKIEANYGFTNRVGKSFKNGFKGVLGIGGAGCGKTETLSRIFKGLKLDKKHKDGSSIGVWIPSGISTGVGLFEMLTQNNRAVIVIDELDAGTALHVNILKQVAHGIICRMKHREVNPTPFTGILLGATNGIPFTKKTVDHMIAMLERFTVVYLRGSDDVDYYDAAMAGLVDSMTDKDWMVITKALMNKCDYDLTTAEIAFGKKLFRLKARQSLDTTKALYRQANDVQDILLFLKRLCEVEDITDHPGIMGVAEQLVEDTVHVNPAKFLQMNAVERAIYTFIDGGSNRAVSFAEISEQCECLGMMIDARTIRTMLRRMVTVRILNKFDGDIYSTRNRDQKVEEVGELADVLRL